MRQGSGANRRTRGRFITFEGGEGSGKSTQLRRLAETMPPDTLTTREPGGTERAEAIRSALLSGAVAPLGVEAEALMFAAARSDHVDRVIAPALAKGSNVLCDRFADSSRAYQAPGRLPMESLQRVAVAGCWPDLTLIFDIDPEEGVRRVQERDGGLDRFEASDVSELHRRRDAFLAIAEREPGRCVVIDADGSPDDVHDRTLLAVRERLPEIAERIDG